MELYNLCLEHYKESRSGAISFSKGFYTKACKELGIKYNTLSRTGKALLKEHAIETLSHPYDVFKEGDYYLNFK